jgi:oxygen-independent coproporphyrinogen-3 oxidase
MCNFETSWFNRDEFFEDLPQVIKALKEMRMDGLIALESNSLKITDHGKPFVRNVCMAFDRRLQKNKPETQLFSMTV